MKLNIYMITGCFAPYHDGHTALIHAALNHLPHDRHLVIVGVNDDAYLSNKTNFEVAVKYPLVERMEAVQSANPNVIVIPNSDTYALAVTLRPFAIVVGDDYTESEVVGQEYAKQVIIVPRTPISSTKVRDGTN